MAIKVRIVNNRIGETKKAIQNRLMRVGDDSANRIVKGIETRMRSGKSGRHYPGLPNRSSAPGEAPAVQSGDLIGSIAVVKIEGLGSSVVVSDEKAAWLEYGTAEIAARPFLRPAADEEMPRFQKAVENELIYLAGRP